MDRDGLIKEIYNKCTDDLDYLRKEMVADFILAREQRLQSKVEKVEKVLDYTLNRQGTDFTDVLKAYVDGTKQALSLLREE
jgi:hypothetical protein